MSKFSDASYDILKTYFDVIKTPRSGTDNSYILGQNHTIVADGGVFTRLYQENSQNDMIAHNFRIIDIIGNNFKFKYEGIGSVHSQATELEIGKPMFFRKDEKFRDWLVNNIDLYEDFVNTNKLFIYFGMIYPVADSTGQVGIHFNIQFEGMKNFVSDALPENNRNTNIDEFLEIYYDRVAHPIYNMTKQLWSFFDAKEVNLKHLDYLATRAGISTDTDLIEELPLREFVDLLPYWMKRKSSYTSYYIIHKILLANTKNKLNIYEKWAEWCLRDLRGDKPYILPADFESHHIRQHYGKLVSGGAGPEYYDQWNELGDDFQSDLVLSPTETATDVYNDQNDIIGWRNHNCDVRTIAREGERWAMHLESTAVSGFVASEPFRMVQGHSYHFEFDGGARRAGRDQWLIKIETPRASAGLPEYQIESIQNGDMEVAGVWTSWTGSPTVFERSHEQAHSPGHSWKITVSGAWQGLKSKDFFVEEGMVYDGALWVYPDDATEAWVTVRKGDDSDWDFTKLFTGLTQDAWNFLTFSYTCTQAGSLAYFRAGTANLTSGTWYFDDISLLHGETGSPNERVFTTLRQDGYGDDDVHNAYVTSGGYIVPTVTADDYQIKLFSPFLGDDSYYDNVYLVKIPTPKTGFPRPYPVYSEAPTADCRANSWDFGSDLDMQEMTIYNDDSNNITGKYSEIIQVDDYSPEDDVTVGYPGLPWIGYAPDHLSAQSASATGEYNISNFVNLDSFSKPSGGMVIWGQQVGHYTDILRGGIADPDYDFLAVEYVLRHRDGDWSNGSAQSGPARRFNIHEGYQGNLYSRSTSGDFYRADTPYYLGIHKVTQPYEKVNVKGHHLQATNDVQQMGSQGPESLFDGILENFEGLNTNNSDPGAYLYFDMGEGNDQPISMARFYRNGSSGTAPIWDIEASTDGFSTSIINLYPDWQPALDGWNKVAWTNSTPYRFFRLFMQNSPGINSGYTELEFYKGTAENAEFRLNIYNKERMKNPVDLIESVRLPLHADQGFGGIYAVNKLFRETPSTAPTAALYYDIQDLKLSGGYTRSIAPTGNLILTPHYNVEIDLSSEPMGPIDEIITVGQADEIIRYWNYLKPVDKFVDHSFLISPVGKIDELHESVSLYDPLELGICDTRFIGVNTLSTSAAPENTNLLDNYLMNDTGYWRKWVWRSATTTIEEHGQSFEQFYSPSASWKMVTSGGDAAYWAGFESQNITIPESGFEYQVNAKVWPVDVDNIRVVVTYPDGDPDQWPESGGANLNTQVADMNLGAWNNIQMTYTETRQGPWARVGFLSPSAGTWYIDDVYFTKGKQDLFTDTSVEKRTFATNEWPITHNLKDVGVMTQIFDPDENILYPKRLEIVDGNRVRAYFNAGQRGRAFTAAVKEWGKYSNTHFFSPAVSAWDVTHNLGTSGASGVCYQCYNADLSSNIVPENVQIIDRNNLKVTFPMPVSGYCFIRDDDFYHEQTTAEETWRVTHNINARGLICHAFDHDGFRQYPETIEMENFNTARIDWAEPVSGSACFLFFQREFTEDTLLAAMGASGGLTDKVIGAGGSPHGFWKVGDGATLGFDPIVANDLDSVTASGGIDDILVTHPDPSGSILFNFHVPREDQHTITEMGIFDLDKNLQYYTKTGELHKPEDVQLDVRYRIRKFPTGV